MKLTADVKWHVSMLFKLARPTFRWMAHDRGFGRTWGQVHAFPGQQLQVPNFVYRFSHRASSPSPSTTTKPPNLPPATPPPCVPPCPHSQEPSP